VGSLSYRKIARTPPFSSLKEVTFQPLSRWILSFYICSSYVLCFYGQKDCWYVIFIEFGDVWNYGLWVWTRLDGLDARKCELKLACVIVVIFGINHGFMILDDHFCSNQDARSVYMNWAWSRISLIYMSVVGFESSTIIWINLGGLRMLYMWLALNCMLCKLCQDGWSMGKILYVIIMDCLD